MTTADQLIIDVRDFPRPGVTFRDITPLLGDPDALAEVVEDLAEGLRPHRPDAVLALEARGFLLAPPVAERLGVRLVVARKPGKLPRPTHEIDYELDYGPGRLEIHRDAVPEGARIAIVDDVLATGASAEAAATLVRELGGEVVGCGFAIVLEELVGRDRLAGVPVSTAVTR